MKIDILTLFPEMFEALNHSILSRAQKNNLIEIPPNSSILDFSQHQNRLSYSSNSQIWESDGIQVCHFRGRYKEHIAEITDLGMYDSPAVEFQIGEDPNNVFHHVVNHVASAKGLTLINVGHTTMPSSC